MQIKKYKHILLSVLIIVSVFFIAVILRQKMTDSSLPLNIELLPTDNASDKGTAVIKEISNETVVLLSFPGETEEDHEDLPEVAVIVSGSCNNPGEKQYTLTAIDAGQSETDLPLRLSEFKRLKPFAIEVYASLKDPTVLSCGEVK